MTTRYRRAPDVLLSRRDGRAFLTRLDTGDVYEANDEALLVFEAAEGGASFEDVLARLAAAFPEVPRDEITHDVGDTLDAFAHWGLLTPVGD